MSTNGRCTQCGSTITDRFCEHCGADSLPRISQREAERTNDGSTQLRCPGCGAELEGRFCQRCGADSRSTTSSPTEGTPVAIGSRAVPPALSRVHYGPAILFCTIVASLLLYNAGSTLLMPYSSGNGSTCGSMLRPLRYELFDPNHTWLGWAWGAGENYCDTSMGAHQSEFWFSLLFMVAALAPIAYWRASQDRLRSEQPEGQFETTNAPRAINRTDEALWTTGTDSLGARVRLGMKDSCLELHWLNEFGRVSGRWRAIPLAELIAVAYDEAEATIVIEAMNDTYTIRGVEAAAARRLADQLQGAITNAPVVTEPSGWVDPDHV